MSIKNVVTPPVRSSNAFLSAGKNGEEEDDDRQTERDPGNRSSKEGNEAAIEDQKGLTEILVKHRPEDKGEDERGPVVFEFPEKVTDDPENSHNHDIKNIIINAVGAYQAEEED